MIPLRDSQRSNSTPVITVGLIVVNVLAFLYQTSLDKFSLNHVIMEYGVVPSRLQLTSLVTSMFLHGGWMHLIGNMWFLWIYGDNVEDILGHAKYLIFYLACGVAAALAHVALNGDSRVPTIGASGAIAGVMGAYMVKFPRARIITLIFLFVFVTTIEMPAYAILLYWFVIQIFSGVGSIGYSQISQGGVAWFAHVGGFVTGIVLVMLMRTREPYRLHRELHW
ncbi:MAG TPA: rhomboid family intramembrane serine protease [Bryobacteraceae bacterium]|nr:rhomboid family intramembrane serine protease [Bryobacteraceae bacterium]